MRVLIVEDDEKLSYLLQFQLEKEGFHTDTCQDGGEALCYMEQDGYDIILLDRMLPHTDGITILKAFRGKGFKTPVIILTALGEVNDKIVGLDSGADDYLVKPFAFEELLARIRCIRRRPSGLENAPVLTLQDLSFCPDTSILSNSSSHDSCTLSKKEGELLELFLRNSGQTLPRNLILSRIWGPDAEIEDGNLDNYIYFLRRRFKTLGSILQIKTIRGIGYCLISSKSNDSREG